MLRRLREGGIRRFYLAGSMGMEDPRQVGALFRRVAKELPDCEVGYHVHNLSGWGTANVLAAVDAGATFIEGSICGIGGGIAMPTSVASVGNLPTEDLVAMFEAMGVRTGVDPERGRGGVARDRGHAGHRGAQPRGPGRHPRRIAGAGPRPPAQPASGMRKSFREQPGREAHPTRRQP